MRRISTADGLNGNSWARLSRGFFATSRFHLGLVLLWSLWLMCPARPVLAERPAEGEGPFPTRNYNPVQLLFLSLPAEKATPLPRNSYEVSLELAESNTILVESTPRMDATLKFETFRSALNIKRGVTNRLEIGLEIPYFYRNNGFLDPFIISLEDAFGNLNPDRIRFTDGSFGGYEIRRDGKVILSGGDHQSGLGDLSLSGKYLVLREGPAQPAVALRLAVKFPTGNFDRAFGSGKRDTGIGLVLQKSWARRWFVYLNQDVVFPGGHFGSTDINLNPAYSAALALEYLGTASLSFVGQLDYYRTPFRKTGVLLLDGSVFEGVLGMNYRIKPRLLWRLYGIENFADPAGAAADFTLVTSIGFRF